MQWSVYKLKNFRFIISNFLNLWSNLCFIILHLFKGIQIVEFESRIRCSITRNNFLNSYWSIRMRQWRLDIFKIELTVTCSIWTVSSIYLTKEHLFSEYLRIDVELCNIVRIYRDRESNFRSKFSWNIIPLILRWGAIILVRDISPILRRKCSNWIVLPSWLASS